MRLRDIQKGLAKEAIRKDRRFLKKAKVAEVYEENGIQIRRLEPQRHLGRRKGYKFS